jgi:signal transduction histidine kinase
MRAARFTAGRWLALSVGVLAVAALLSVGAAFLAASRVTDARVRLVDLVDPAQRDSLTLLNGMVDQETGVRGYLLGGEPTFLEPYTNGAQATDVPLRGLDALAASDAGADVRDDLALVRRRIDEWRSGYARPVIARVQREGPQTIGDEDVSEGKRRFDALRAAFGRLDATIAAVRGDARDDLERAADQLTIALVFATVVLLGTLAAVAVIARNIVARPLGRLTDEVRAVAGGALRRPVEPSGPKDVLALGHDVEAMRVRIVRELEAVEKAQDDLAAQAQDLARSNAELEQFAYVASHDLQEPLRKVTSFCQMLERRYSGQLDERGEQYIQFAVDGAKRMQALINDLLAFSRVGRMERERELVDVGELVEHTSSSLGLAIEDANATVDVRGRLPEVYGERTLLGLVLQNLIANAIKFRADEPPRVEVSARRDGDMFEFAVADNGIGIDPEYADRIFVIFQRLHARDAYDGTGIGLAMCRKVIEHHGGQIWLDARQNGTGSIFRFTLPVPDIAPEEVKQ